MNQGPLPLWSISAAEMLRQLQTAQGGLTNGEAKQRLASIENFGSLNVICSDKTGTLTEGIAHWHSALGVEGTPSEKVLLYAYLNASYETGFTNPFGRAPRVAGRCPQGSW
jgi:P-type Mg2+ transporter